MQDYSDVKYAIRLRLFREEFMFGPGIAELMEQVEQTGSLSTACRNMKMAYSKGWKIIKRSEQDLGIRLLCGHTGGQGGGCTELTEEGRDLLKRYRAFETALGRQADRLFAEIFQEENRQQ